MNEAKQIRKNVKTFTRWMQLIELNLMASYDILNF